MKYILSLEEMSIRLTDTTKACNEHQFTWLFN